MSGRRSDAAVLVALVWQDRMGQRLAMATHDRDLALAARSFGFDVRGV